MPRIFAFLLLPLHLHLPLSLPFLFLFLILSPNPLRAQSQSQFPFHAAYKPLSLSSTSTRAGAIGFWNIYIVGPPGSTISRALILMHAPQIHDLPNSLAIAALSRQSNRDHRRILSLIIPLAGAALAIWIKDPRLSFIGPGATLLTDLFSKTSFDPTPLTQSIMPDQITIPQSGGIAFTVAASLTPNPQSIGPIPISIPIPSPVQ